MNHLISIIIPVYNQADKIGECLESILSQTYSNYEVIIVNDGSTDPLETVITSYRNRFSADRFFYLSQANQGANPARNAGAAQAHGTFLLFCDADIVLREDCLAKMITALEKHPEISFAYPSFYYGLKLFTSFAYDESRLRAMAYIHTTALIRREHFPGFDDTLKRFQDWDLWLTMLQQGHRGVWLHEPLFTVKTGGTMSTWLPSFAYTWLPFLPAVKKYRTAMKLIKDKHGLV